MVCTKSFVQSRICHYWICYLPPLIVMVCSNPWKELPKKNKKSHIRVFFCKPLMFSLEYSLPKYCKKKWKSQCSNLLSRASLQDLCSLQLLKNLDLVPVLLICYNCQSSVFLLKQHNLLVQGNCMDRDEVSSAHFSQVRL